jgi:hypothetical protein
VEINCPWYRRLNRPAFENREGRASPPTMSFFNGSSWVNPMLAFTGSGQPLWSQTNDTPQIATSDGGVIGSSGTTYDQNGNVTGQAPLPVQSWAGYAYTDGPVDQVQFSPFAEANVFWPFTNFWPTANANNSRNKAAKKLPGPDANHFHWLIASEVTGQGANAFNHITVQVDNNEEVGFGPKGSGPNNSLTPSDVAAVLANKQVRGWIEPRGANVTTLDSVIVYLTPAEANNAQATINGWTGYYQLRGRSCVDFGEAVLASTLFPAPRVTLPRALPKSIRAEEIQRNSVQAP